MSVAFWSSPVVVHKFLGLLFGVLGLRQARLGVPKIFGVCGLWGPGS